MGESFQKSPCHIFVPEYWNILTSKSENIRNMSWACVYICRHFFPVACYFQSQYANGILRNGMKCRISACEIVPPEYLRRSMHCKTCVQQESKPDQALELRSRTQQQQAARDRRNQRPGRSPTSLNRERGRAQGWFTAEARSSREASTWVCGAVPLLAPWERYSPLCWRKRLLLTFQQEDVLHFCGLGA